ncbi:MAG: hypothetical protein IJ179_06045 [Oscillospiraceae bacterium]|nr:hypothetical protein [Oscillospiraceae bacterium]MBQ9249912.1 hypothetical protein [Oscillospiraceae bacterium]
MIKKHFDLQLFDDGGQSGSGSAQGGTAGTGDGGQAGSAGNNGNGSGGSYSFQQAEEIANARAQRAEKAALASYFKQQGMSEDEVSKAIAAYKAQQAASKPDASKITKERDDALAELAALKNSNALRSKGVREEDLDYVMFKIGALMKEDDKLDFDKAAAKYLKDNPRFTASGGGSYRVKTGTDSSGQGGSSGQQGNDSINNAIRKAIRRTY